MINTMAVNGTQIAFDDRGIMSPGPAIVLLAGWHHDHRAWDRLLPYLLQRHRVIRVCWRGHGPDRTPVADFGVGEQVADTIAVLDALEVETFVPLSHAHGGWAALDIAEAVGPDRVPWVMLLDFIMTPPPAEFVTVLRAAQQRENWRTSQRGLAQAWLAGSDNQPVRYHLEQEAGGFGFDMWARACRVIENAYNTWGSPMRRMEKLSAPRPIRHVFSHPKIAEYDASHEEFRARNPWFSYTRLYGETHFPGIELPEHVAVELSNFLHS